MIFFGHQNGSETLIQEVDLSRSIDGVPKQNDGNDGKSWCIGLVGGYDYWSTVDLFAKAYTFAAGEWPPMQGHAKS